MKTVTYQCDWCKQEIPNGHWELNLEKVTEFGKPGERKTELCDSCANKAYETLIRLGSEIANGADPEQTKTKVVVPQTLSKVSFGHGHVYPRIDGAKARCGGPAICSECARDQARLNTELRSRYK